jgi:hypothetical protein
LLSPRCRAAKGSAKHLASIQSLMARAQEQLDVCSELRAANPLLSGELKSKAERHLDFLMRLAEQQAAPQRAQRISGAELERQLRDLSEQLDLEQQAARTVAAANLAKRRDAAAQQAAAAAAEREDAPAAAAPANATSSTAAAAATGASRGSSSSTTGSNGAAALALQEQLAAATAQLAAARAELGEAEAKLQEYHDLQITYDRLCQDMYRLRMQLQAAQHQGHDEAAVAASMAQQHRQVRCCVGRSKGGCVRGRGAPGRGFVHTQALPACVCMCSSWRAALVPRLTPVRAARACCRRTSRG